MHMDRSVLGPTIIPILMSRGQVCLVRKPQKPPAGSRLEGMGFFGAEASLAIYE